MTEENKSGWAMLGETFGNSVGITRLPKREITLEEAMMVPNSLSPAELLDLLEDDPDYAERVAETRRQMLATSSKLESLGLTVKLF